MDVEAVEGLLVRKSFIGCLFALAMDVVVAQNMDAVQIKTTNLGKGIHMLVGQGGNIGVSAGLDDAWSTTSLRR